MQITHILFSFAGRGCACAVKPPPPEILLRRRESCLKVQCAAAGGVAVLSQKVLYSLVTYLFPVIEAFIVFRYQYVL